MDNNSIGYRVLNLRKKKQLTQKELAEKVHVTEATMSRYENNLREPKGEIINRIALALNTTTDYLLGRSNNSLPIRELDDNKSIDVDLDTFIKKLEEVDGLKFHGELIDEQTRSIILKTIIHAREIAEEMHGNKVNLTKQ
ncbi:helix-turn-helix domain-containing protein [Vallitalea sp.]|jgi:transcriptional regulator with XRE-family HTH domain|uniref:helix-turn-helix domain-containing protein n=1 Tax=Vallitalea sp. TaxID=1882829 RepID=UPI0025FBBE0F|nr:helix-turn-helix transcriptional regulator [Vallitalea sp.]MCT4686563.1 helix-turn-helix transcriptional regulator [Vallitalea sp.]